MIAWTAEVDDYLARLPQSRRAAVAHLREVITNNLPDGFEEVCDKMPAYVVPLATFPPGYHVSPGTPLPFVSFANQKHYVTLYHFGLYVDQPLLQWFEDECPKHMTTPLDMGKNCLRFRKPEQMPFELIAELMRQRTPDEWIQVYAGQLRGREGRARQSGGARP